MPYDDIVLEVEDKMEKAVNVLAEELRGVRTGRASAALGRFIDGFGILMLAISAGITFVAVVMRYGFGVGAQLFAHPPCTINRLDTGS